MLAYTTQCYDLTNSYFTPVYMTVALKLTVS